MTENQIVRIVTAAIDELKPWLKELIEREVEHNVNTTILNKLNDEFGRQLHDRIREAVYECVDVEVKVHPRG